MPDPTPRLGSLADTAPAAAPRMMSGQFQGVLDPAMRRLTEQEIGFFPLDPDAIRERFEQEIGFADFGKYFQISSEVKTRIGAMRRTRALVIFQTAVCAERRDLLLGALV